MYIVIYLYISLYANIIKFGLLSFANNQRKEQKYSQKQDKDHRYGNLINRSDVRLIGDKIAADRMLIFLREHYDSNVTVTKETSLTDNDDPNNSIGVYRYSKTANGQ